MKSLRFNSVAAVLLVAVGLSLASSASASVAGDSDMDWCPHVETSGSVSLDQPAYTAHENQGDLTMTIMRSGDLSQPENVGYGVKQQDGQSGVDFDAVPSTYVTIPAGQQTYSFQVHIIDRGMNATPVHALAYIYRPCPQPMGANSNSIVTILHDDPLDVRDPSNPLGVANPVPGNPVAGAKLFVDPDSPAAQARAQYAHSKPAMAGLLSRIADEPGAKRFWMWNLDGNIAGRVARYLQTTQLEQPGTTVMLSTYSLIHGQRGSTATPEIQARYDDFINQVAAGIGNYHVIFFLELDSLITAPGLTPSQLAIREAELRYAISVLEADPHVVVYLDGGAADASTATTQARLLRDSGVAQAQGFFLNSTHFDWTARELQYGQQISRMLGGTHFIVNTGENGRGPLVPKNRVKNGNEVLCNPPGRGLGPLSVSNEIAQPTGYPDADGFLWFTNPGGSGGPCRPGAPGTGAFWPEYAAMLAKNWVNYVSGPRIASAQPKHHRRRRKHHRRRHG